MTYHVRFYCWKDVSTGFMHEDKYQDHWSVVLAFWSDFFYKNSNSAHSILKSSNFIQRSFICCQGYKTGRICLTFFIFKDGERYTYSVKWFRFIVNIYGLEKCHDLELCFLLLYTTNMESLQKFSALGFMFSLIDTKQQDCRIKYLGKKDLVIFWFHFNLFKFIDHMVISAYLK